MAYLAEEDDQNKKNQAAPLSSDSQSSQPVTTSSAPGSSSMGGAKSPTGSPSNKQAAQPFTNLNAYLSANAPQIEQQANTIAGNLTNQYGQTKGQIDTGVQDFNQQVSGGYTAPNQDIVNQAAANPTQFVQNPDNISAFQKQLNNKYTGPANFETTTPYQGLNQQVTQQAQNANLLNTPSGIQTYLRSSGRNPTQGENVLDSVLLQGNPEAISTVQNAAAPFNTLGDYLTQSASFADKKASAAPTIAQESAKYASDKFNGPQGVIPTFQQGLTTKAQQEEAKRSAYNTDLSGAYSKASGADSALKAFLGATGLSVSNPFGSVLGMSPSATPASTTNVASANDYAIDAALNQLMGNQDFLPDSLTNQAGSYVAPSGTIPDVGNLSVDAARAAANATNAWATTHRSGADQARTNQVLGPAQLALFDSLKNYSPRIKVFRDASGKIIGTNIE